jgi:hypothetical protein
LVGSAGAKQNMQNPCSQFPRGLAHLVLNVAHEWPIGVLMLVLPAILQILDAVFLRGVGPKPAGRDVTDNTCAPGYIENRPSPIAANNALIEKLPAGAADPGEFRKSVSIETLLVRVICALHVAEIFPLDPGAVMSRRLLGVRLHPMSLEMAADLWRYPNHFLKSAGQDFAAKLRPGS